MIESHEKSVTDRLRACATLSYGSAIDRMMDEFDARNGSDFCNKVSDAIEAEEAEMRDFCKRVEEAAKNREDLDVFGVEYMPLPLDKNGEPWHVGDVIKFGDGGHEVVYISPTHVSFTSHGFGTISVVADMYEHYKEPTVEDVLEEALSKAANLDRKDGYWPSAADITNIVNEIAPKLQLKER